MARNEEKAMNLFNKWQTFKHEFHAVNANRRPLFATECESLVDAEKFRREIVRDLTKKIAMIQNATLGEFKIRDLNDEINKMMKQKHYWEIRIRELGGSDLKRSRRLFDLEGKELPGQPGYRYYGAAKDLPGVRELFAEEDADIELRKKKRSRGDLYQHITPDYYGYRDEDDGILKEKEAIIEKAKIAKVIKQHQEKLEHDLNDKMASSDKNQVFFLHNLEQKKHLEEESDFEAFLQKHLVFKTHMTGIDSSENTGELQNIDKLIDQATLDARKKDLLNFFA